MATRNLNASLALPVLQASAALRLPPAVSAAVALPALQASATLRLPPAVSAAVMLPALQATVTLRLPPAVSAAVALPALQASVTLRLPPAVSAAVTLPALQASATLRLPPAMSAAVMLPALQASVTLRLPPAVSAAVTLPALQASALLRVVLRRGLRLPWAISVREQAMRSLRWAMQASDVTGGRRVRYSLRTPAAPLGFQVAWDGPRRVASMRLAYSVRFAHAVAVRWSLRLSRDGTVAWGAGLTTAWGAAWASAGVLRTSTGVSWSCSPATRLAGTSVWSLAAPPMQVGWQASYGAPVVERRRLRAWWSSSWSGPDGAEADARLHQRPSVWIETADGHAVPVERLDSLVQSDDDGLWRAKAVTFGWPTKVGVGAALTLRIGMSTWALMVQSVATERSEDDSGTATVVAVSAPGFWADAAVGSLDGRAQWHGGQADVIAAALAWPLALHWSCVSLHIDPPLVHEHVWPLSRWEALKRLARAAGGRLRVAAAGDTVHVEPLGEVPVHLHGAVPWLPALEGRGRRENRPGLSLRTHSVSDRLEVQTEGNAADQEVVVDAIAYPVRTLTLRSTDPGWSEDLGGGALAWKDEQVLMVDGVARLSAPLSALHDAVVSPPNVGPLRWRPGEPYVWLDAPTPAVVTVRYRTRVQRGRVSLPPNGQAVVWTEDDPA